jgi:cystathionine gamma-synthase
MERHQANALAVTEFLRSRADVASVRYPGFGGMVSFLPAPGGPGGRSAAERALAIAESTRLFTLAESLGGVESLIELPAAMTHLSVAGSPLEVDPALVRLSVGIEAAGDLIADLARALDRA